MTAPVRVTDHAILRYLERCKGLDVEAIRAHIATLCQGPRELGAVAVKSEGGRFLFAGNAVVTVVQIHQPNPTARDYVPGTRFEAVGDVASRVLAGIIRKQRSIED